MGSWVLTEFLFTDDKKMSWNEIEVKVACHCEGTKLLTCKWTLKWLILWYVNFMSITKKLTWAVDWMFKIKPRNHSIQSTNTRRSSCEVRLLSWGTGSEGHPPGDAASRQSFFQGSLHIVTEHVEKECTAQSFLECRLFEAQKRQFGENETSTSSQIRH